MKMKKVVSMLLVGAMTLSLAACSGGKSSGSSDDKSSSKGGSDKKSYHVIYLTPSTASQFWTYVGKAEREKKREQMWNGILEKAGIKKEEK